MYAPITYNPINLDDAIWRMFDYTDNFNWWQTNRVPSTCIAPENNPVRRSYKGNQIPTWKDWISILGGGGGQPDVTPYTEMATIHANNMEPVKYGIRFNNSNYPGHEQDAASIKDWGITVGPYKGINGRPICETKLLDDSFFYYEDWARFIFPGAVRSPSECCLLAIYFNSYDGTGWDITPTNMGGIWWYDQDTGTAHEEHGPSPNSPYVKLCAGVYLCRYRFISANTSVSNMCPYGFFRVDSPNNPQVIICKAGTIPRFHLWVGKNCIFFVDDYCYITPSWYSYDMNGGPGDGTAFSEMVFEAEVYRITPPGSWHA